MGKNGIVQQAEAADGESSEASVHYQHYLPRWEMVVMRGLPAIS